MSGQYRAPRGTRDVLPGESGTWEWAQQAAKEIFERWGYRRITTPTFEQTELFQRAIGEATDIVTKEMYTFEDRAGRSLTLRPEGTASVVRAFIEHNLQSQPQPVKLYYIGPMYRYERPQAGRYREFWQIGVEVLGSPDPALDAEVILLLVEYLEALGLTGLVTKINSMGHPEVGCRLTYTEALRDYLRSPGVVENLCDECKVRADANPLRVFDCKNEGCHGVLGHAPSISDYLCLECAASFAEVRELLGRVGLPHEIDPMLVRGFDYYTRTTFEVQSASLGAQNALGGGGRYDRLVEEYGGPTTAAIGFAIGLERILLALGEKFSYDGEGLAAYVVSIGAEVRSEAFALLQRLRGAGLASDMDYAGRSLKSQMKQADRRGARRAVVLGPDELEQGRCTIRDMSTGDQRQVDVDKVIEEVSKP